MEEEENRAKTDQERLLKSKSIVETDIEREKNIIQDAQSNEKRLIEEKNNLIDNLYNLISGFPRYY